MTTLFKIHYFLWYGAHTGIFGYESVYAQQYTNASTVQFGTLKMVLPFIAVVVTPIVCSIADRKRAHRFYFTLSLLLTTITMLAYLFLPLTIHRAKSDSTVSSNRQQHSFGSNSKQNYNETYVWYGLSLSRSDGAQTAAVPNISRTETTLKANPDDRTLWLGPFVFFCLNTLIFELAMAVNTCLSDSFAVLQAEENKSSFGQIILWGTFGWALSAALLSYINQLDGVPRLLPGLAFSAACLIVDLILVVLWPRPNDFRLDYIPVAAASSLTGSSSPAHKEPTDYLPLNEANQINLGTELIVLKTPEGTFTSRKRKTKSPVELLMAERGTSAGAKGTKELPTAKTDSSPHSSEPHSLANSEIVMKHSGASVGSRAEQNERPLASHQPQDVVREPVKTTSFTVQLHLFFLIVDRRRSLIRFLILFVLSGFFMAMQWNYFFLFLEKAFGDQFALISALSMVAQSILGELPFFILSRKFIDTLGRSHTLSLSLICLGLRFLVYRFLLVHVSWYCVFLADCLQGPTYGLFYVVMTEIGLEYSFCDDQTIGRLAAKKLIDVHDVRQVDAIRLALRSTVQSVAFACYEGLGVGLGSLVGGLLLARYDFDLLWLTMAVAAIVGGLINVAIECLCREHDPNE